MEWTALGMPLDVSEDNDLAQPVDVVVVVKGLDSSGELSWWTAATKDISAMERAGMLDWALRKTQKAQRV